ncbi:hypothetical protein AGABI1DRAFT_12817, partial [Agaricus bisporus var. burnettii JB137-S8]
TSEVIGILPIPDDIRERSAMAQYVPVSDSRQQYTFIASMQGTRKPVLPVHTPDEEHFFHELMQSDPSFSPQSGEPHWNKAVRVWNSNAERVGIYYKLVEQLKTYYAKWKARLHIKEAFSMTAAQRRSVARQIHDPHCSLLAPAIPAKPLELHHVLGGLSTMIPHPPELSHHLSSTSIVPVATQPVVLRKQRIIYTSAKRTHEIIVPCGRSLQEDNAWKHSNNVYNACIRNRSHSYVIPSVRLEMHANQCVASQLHKKMVVAKSRKPRTCKKCAKPECPGKRSVKDCKNLCHDCGKYECRGRNSKRLHLTC